VLAEEGGRNLYGEAMRAFFLATFFSLFASFVFAESDEPPASIQSPDGQSAVRIIHSAMPGADELFDFFTIEVLVGKKVVSRYPTSGYLMKAEWSADGKWMAVSNRRGNSGDYLWIFSLPGGKCVKRPDDALGEKWFDLAEKAARKQAKGAKEVYKSWMTADAWRGAGELVVGVRFRFSGDARSWDVEEIVSLESGVPVFKGVGQVQGTKN